MQLSRARRDVDVVDLSADDDEHSRPVKRQRRCSETALAEAPTSPEVTSCPICLDDIEQPSQHARALPCLHTFCVACLVKWAEVGKRECALCRVPMEGYLHDIVSDTQYREARFPPPAAPPLVPVYGMASMAYRWWASLARAAMDGSDTDPEEGEMDGEGEGELDGEGESQSGEESEEGEGEEDDEEQEEEDALQHELLGGDRGLADLLRLHREVHAENRQNMLDRLGAVGYQRHWGLRPPPDVLEELEQRFEESQQRLNHLQQRLGPPPPLYRDGPYGPLPPLSQFGAPAASVHQPPPPLGGPLPSWALPPPLAGPPLGLYQPQPQPGSWALYPRYPGPVLRQPPWSQPLYAGSAPGLLPTYAPQPYPYPPPYYPPPGYYSQPYGAPGPLYPPPSPYGAPVPSQQQPNVYQQLPLFGAAPSLSYVRQHNPYGAVPALQPHPSASLHQLHQQPPPAAASLHLQQPVAAPEVQFHHQQHEGHVAGCPAMRQLQQLQQPAAANPEPAQPLEHYSHRPRHLGSHVQQPQLPQFAGFQPPQPFQVLPPQPQPVQQAGFVSLLQQAGPAAQELRYTQAPRSSFDSLAARYDSLDARGHELPLPRQDPGLSRPLQLASAAPYMAPPPADRAPWDAPGMPPMLGSGLPSMPPAFGYNGPWSSSQALQRDGQQLGSSEGVRAMDWAVPDWSVPEQQQERAGTSGLRVGHTSNSRRRPFAGTAFNSDFSSAFEEAEEEEEQDDDPRHRGRNQRRRLNN